MVKTLEMVEKTESFLSLLYPVTKPKVEIIKTQPIKTIYGFAIKT